MKILLIIPAYNEQDTIQSVIMDIKKFRYIDILVINDGSVDKTSEIVREQGVLMIELYPNRGIGKAVQTGYKYAKENGYDIAIQVDADGQHDISKLGNLIAFLINKNADLVIGSRYVTTTSYESSIFRYFGTKYFSTLLFVLNRKTIKDVTSGYRAVNKRVIELFTNYYPQDYPEVITLSYLLKNNYRVFEIPVNMKPRQGGKTSISAFDSIIYFLKVTYVCVKDRLSTREYFKNI